MLKRIEWSDERFNVGNEALNKQHKKIIELLNQLSEDADDNFTPGMYFEKLKELEPYLKQHLKFEERFLEKQGYPDFVEHKKTHDAYLKKMEEYKELARINDSESRFIIQAFLLGWWEKHIVEEDMKYFKAVAE